MRIDARDHQLLILLNRFKQLHTSQIKILIFPSSSRSPLDRTLTRLLDSKRIKQVERRLVGGSKGGSGLFVYEPYGSSRRGVDHHALAIADAYVELIKLERAGRIKINGYSTEPDCHLTVGREELKPDMYVDLELTHGGPLRLWLEVDLGSEGQKQIKGKLARYYRAYVASADSPLPFDEFPKVVWLAIDDIRAKELKWLVKQSPREAKGLFRVMTLQEFAASLVLLRLFHNHILTLLLT